MDKPFAVVQFLEGNEEDEETACSYSEIPTKWLINNNTACKWPNSHNATPFIKKYQTPLPHWPSYPVKVISYCDSLASARKRASNADYTSTEETGRGKRRKIRPVKSSVEEASSEDESSDGSGNLTPPPSLAIRKKTFKSKSPTHTQSNLTNPSPSSKASACNLPPATAIEAIPSELPSTSANSQEMDLISNTNSTLVWNATFLDSNTIVNTDTTVTPAVSSVTPALSSGSSLLSVVEETDIKDIKQFCATILHYVKSINEKLLSSNTPRNRNFEVLDAFLPLKDIEELKTFEALLASNENNIKDVFKEFASNIGGKNPKHTTSRILKRVFTNKLGSTCSMLGFRGNHKVGHTLSMKIIKEVIVNSQNNVREADFENYASEWFRLSNLRLQRDENKKKAIEK